MKYVNGVVRDQEWQTAGQTYGQRNEQTNSRLDIPTLVKGGNTIRFTVSASVFCQMPRGVIVGGTMQHVAKKNSMDLKI